MARSSEIDRWIDSEALLSDEFEEDEIDFAQQEVGLEGNEDASDADDIISQSNRNIDNVIESVILGAGDCPVFIHGQERPTMSWETMEGYEPVTETFSSECGPKIPVDNPLNIF
ncbi:hypothetical protein J6590_107885 [Homalodisca vitripennis]|nr:hypothetical protein J6590_107885 [Homalodisca vitripennis]